MDLDRYKDALREALREEAEKIAARGDDRVRSDLFLLLQGAHSCLAERLGYGTVTNGSDYFKRGWALAGRIEI
jgi:hypothetical protein